LRKDVSSAEEELDKKIRSQQRSYDEKKRSLSRNSSLSKSTGDMRKKKTISDLLGKENTKTANRSAMSRDGPYSKSTTDVKNSLNRTKEVKEKREWDIDFNVFFFIFRL